MNCESASGELILVNLSDFSSQVRSEISSGQFIHSLNNFCSPPAG
jgi:hypothetical protein